LKVKTEIGATYGMRAFLIGARDGEKVNRSIPIESTYANSF